VPETTYSGTRVARREGLEQADEAPEHPASSRATASRGPGASRRTRPDAQFFCTRLTKFSIRSLTDASSAGKFIFIPSFQAGVPDTVLGAHINVFQDMADYTTTDAYALAYGDMKETFQIVDRQGISVLVDPYTSKPYVIFYTTARVGGDVINFESMKFLKFGTS
jgi:HK97 family phage major capsid protein